MSSSCSIRFSEEEVNNKKEEFNNKYKNHTLSEKLEELKEYKLDYSLEGILYNYFLDELIKYKCNKILDILKGESANDALNLLKYAKSEIESKQRNLKL